MKVTETELPGVVVIEPRVHTDDRGFFLEIFNEDRARRAAADGLPTAIRQINQSRSRQDVLRGLHYQLGRPQGKLITVLHGEIFDVAADVRRGSPTFGQWTSVQLSADTPRALWVPPGFAHGFCVLSDRADVIYACTDVYFPEGDRGVRWDDPTLGIDWPTREPILSPKDAALPELLGAGAELPEWRP